MEPYDLVTWVFAGAAALVVGSVAISLAVDVIRESLGSNTETTKKKGSGR